MYKSNTKTFEGINFKHFNDIFMKLSSKIFIDDTITSLLVYCQSFFAVIV